MKLINRYERKFSMVAFTNILVPIDFSEGSDKALEYAKQVCDKQNVVIHLLHSVEPAVYPADWSYSRVNFAQLETELLATSTKELEIIATNLRNDGYTVSTEVTSGRGSEVILAYSKSKNIDLICISTHGRSGFEHFLFGSTTEKVLRQAECPVLVVRIKQ